MASGGRGEGFFNPIAPDPPEFDGVSLDVRESHICVTYRIPRKTINPIYVTRMRIANANDLDGYGMDERDEQKEAHAEDPTMTTSHWWYDYRTSKLVKPSKDGSAPDVTHIPSFIGGTDFKGLFKSLKFWNKDWVDDETGVENLQYFDQRVFIEIGSEFEWGQNYVVELSWMNKINIWSDWTRKNFKLPDPPLRCTLRDPKKIHQKILHGRMNPITHTTVTSPGAARVLAEYTSLCLIILNIVFICMQLFRMFNQDEARNRTWAGSKWAVAWFEFIGLLALASWIIYTFVTEKYSMLVDGFRFMQSWSVLKAINLFDPQRLINMIYTMKRINPIVDNKIFLNRCGYCKTSCQGAMDSATRCEGCNRNMKYDDGAGGMMQSWSCPKGHFRNYCARCVHFLGNINHREGAWVKVWNSFGQGEDQLTHVPSFWEVITRNKIFEWERGGWKDARVESVRMTVGGFYMKIKYLERDMGGGGRGRGAMDGPSYKERVFSHINQVLRRVRLVYEPKSEFEDKQDGNSVWANPGEHWLVDVECVKQGGKNDGMLYGERIGEDGDPNDENNKIIEIPVEDVRQSSLDMEQRRFTRNATRGICELLTGFFRHLCRRKGYMMTWFAGFFFSIFLGIVAMIAVIGKFQQMADVLAPPECLLDVYEIREIQSGKILERRGCKIVDGWDAMGFFLFLGFANQVFSMVDKEATRIETLEKFIFSVEDNDLSVEDARGLGYMDHIIKQQLIKVHCWFGWLFALTLTADDVQAICVVSELEDTIGDDNRTLGTTYAKDFYTRDLKLADTQQDSRGQDTNTGPNLCAHPLTMFADNLENKSVTAWILYAMRWSFDLFLIVALAVDVKAESTDYNIDECASGLMGGQFICSCSLVWKLLLALLCVDIAQWLLTLVRKCSFCDGTSGNQTSRQAALWFARIFMTVWVFLAAWIFGLFHVLGDNSGGLPCPEDGCPNEFITCTNKFYGNAPFTKDDAAQTIFYVCWIISGLGILLLIYICVVAISMCVPTGLIAWCTDPEKKLFSNSVDKYGMTKEERIKKYQGHDDAWDHNTQGGSAGGGGSQRGGTRGGYDDGYYEEQDAGYR